jgi:hypothetical protein
LPWRFADMFFDNIITDAIRLADPTLAGRQAALASERERLHGVG